MTNIRKIARAAKLRDWEAIDAALQDMLVCGDTEVLRGFTDARVIRGQEPRYRLETPDPLTIHDLPCLDDVETYAGAAVRKWRKKAA